MTQPPLPPGDVLLHAGDLSIIGSKEEIQEQLTWLSSQPHKHKVIVAGNHDVLLDEAFLEAFSERRYGDPNVTASDLDFGSLIYLRDETIQLDFPDHGTARRLSIYGSPTTPQYGFSAFQVPRETDVWSGRIPDGTDILLTHGPPWNHLDGRVRHSGCTHLAREVARTRPKLVVFGHIHVGYGKEEVRLDRVRALYEGIIGAWYGRRAVAEMGLRILWTKTLNGFHLVQKDSRKTTFVNSAVVGGKNNEYKNPPIVVQLYEIEYIYGAALIWGIEQP